MNSVPIANKLIMLWRAEKKWRKPKAAKTVIYDRCGSDVLLRYIKRGDVEILDVRGESINLYVLLKCILSFNLSGGSYVNKYISIVKPSVIITFIDNNSRFYELKSRYQKAITMFVQNGLRVDPGYVLGCQKNNLMSSHYQVDYMLTFGVAIGVKYREYIEGRAIPVGSIRNNLCQVEKSANEKSLVFISQLSAPPGNYRQSYFVSIGDRFITWEEFYSVEGKVIKFLAKYCDKNKLALQICGRSSDSSGQEYEFFRELIGDKKWQFMPRDDLYGSYHSIDSAEVVVGVDSTLAYESLARGKRTGVFSVRGKILCDPSRNFGWPEELPDSGPFWTNHADECEFEKVLDYLTSVSDADWEKTRKEYVPNLMEYDPGNTRLISLLQKLDVQLNDRYVSHVQQ